MSGADARLDVLIGADSLMSHRSGVGRMTFEIVRAARMAETMRHIHLLTGGRVMPAAELEAVSENYEARPNWKARLVSLPGMGVVRQARSLVIARRIQAVVNARTVYYEPNMIARRLAMPTVVTINDLSWHHQPSWHPAERLAWIDRGLAQTLGQARRITALSQFTKDAAVGALGVPAAQVTVVPLAPAAAFRPYAAAEAAAVLAQFGLSDRAFVLSISTIEPRKNFDRLFAAHQRLPEALRQRAPLVIAGGKGWGSTLALPAAEAAMRRGELRMLGHIDDSALVVLCARAGVFAYVSLYEGFGLPVIEAMAAGCPVVASATTAIPEVAGGAAFLVDPLDEAAIAEALTAVLEDAALAGRLRRAGVARAAHFSWQRTVAGLAAVWRAALQG